MKLLITFREDENKWYIGYSTHSMKEVSYETLKSGFSAYQLRKLNKDDWAKWNKWNIYQNLNHKRDYSKEETALDIFIDVKILKIRKETKEEE